ncbi:MAG: hypothetical protein RLZZ306_1460 [Bacteroidota bacterium]
MKLLERFSDELRDFGSEFGIFRGEYNDFTNYNEGWVLNPAFVKHYSEIYLNYL